MLPGRSRAGDSLFGSELEYPTLHDFPRGVFPVEPVGPSPDFVEGHVDLRPVGGGVDPEGKPVHLGLRDFEHPLSVFGVQPECYASRRASLQTLENPRIP